MPLLDVADETFLVADHAWVAHALADPARWQRWLPDLSLTPYEERGLKGVRWFVEGGLTGTAEVWLAPSGDGVIVHFFLRAEPAARRPPTRRYRAARLRRRYATTYKKHITAFKDEVEAGRPAGEPRANSPVVGGTVGTFHAPPNR